MITSNLRKIMEEKDVKIRELATMSGLADKTILRARSEHITECRLYTLQVIAKALGCSVKDLFEEG